MEENKDDIINMINQVSDEEYTKANSIFNDLINGKISSRLDQEKIAIANNIFNDEEEDEEIEVDDEDLEVDEDDEDYAFDDEDLEVYEDDEE